MTVIIKIVVFVKLKKNFKLDFDLFQLQLYQVELFFLIKILFQVFKKNSRLIVDVFLQIKEVTLNLINVYCKGNNKIRKKLNEISLIESDSNAFIMSSECHKELFQPKNYQPLFNEATDITTSSFNGTSCKDNIYINNSFTKYYKYEKQVIRDGLTNLSLLNGSKLNEVATSHCPIIIYLSIK